MKLNLIKISDFFYNKTKEVTIFFIVFYVVGIVGLSIELTQFLFVKLIPFALILSFVALISFQKGAWNNKSRSAYILIFILGFAIEVIGVNTKIIFGNYIYGKSLGFKIFETPIIIGMNWLFLVYTSTCIFENRKINQWLKIFFSSGIMLIYDIVLEQVAPKMDMWHWENETVPFQNYIAWFLIALIFNIFIKVFKIEINNSFSKIILICQFLFFLILIFTL